MTETGVMMMRVHYIHISIYKAKKNILGEKSVTLGTEQLKVVLKLHTPLRTRPASYYNFVVALGCDMLLNV